MAWKKYDAALGEFGKPAVEAVEAWLVDNGYQVIDQPHGAYKWDCMARNEAEEAYVEVERRDSWSRGQFSFKTVHVPERRWKSGDAWLFVVRRDLQASLVVFFKYLLVSNRIEVPNKLMPSGEVFFDVPVEWCLPIDMTDKSRLSIAERNRSRVLASIDHSKRQGWGAAHRRSLLGTMAPYGMSTAEWHKLMVECTDEQLGLDAKKKVPERLLFD